MVMAATLDYTSKYCFAILQDAVNNNASSTI